MAGLALAILLIHAVSLAHYPLFFVDEGELSNQFWAVLKGDPHLNIEWPLQGTSIRDYGIEGVVGRLAYQWLGLDYLVGRSVSLSWGIVLLAETFLLGTILYGRRLAALGVLVLLCSSPFFYSAHLIRPDIALAAIGTAAILVVLWALSRGLTWPHAAVGPLLVLGYQVHENVVGYGVAIALLYLWHYGWRCFARRGPWLAFASFAAAGTIYLAGKLIGDPSHQLISPGMQFLISTIHRPPLLIFSPPEMLVAELLRYIELWQLSPLEIIVSVGTLLWTFGHRSRTDQPALIVVAAFLSIFLLALENKSAYYWILVYPYLALLFVSTLQAVCQQAYERSPHRAFQLMAGGWIALSFAFQLALHVLPTMDYDYNRAMQPLRESVPAGASVMAEPTFWMALADHPFTNAWNLSWQQQWHGDSVPQTMQALKPEYIVVGSTMYAFWNDRNPYAGTVMERVYESYARHFPLSGSPTDLLGPSSGEAQAINLGDHGEVVVIPAGWN